MSGFELQVAFEQRRHRGVLLWRSVPLWLAGCIRTNWELHGAPKAKPGGRGLESSLWCVGI